MTDRRPRQLAAVTASARVFMLVVLAAPVAYSQDYPSIISALLLAAVWLGGVLADGIPQISSMAALVVETCLTTFLIAWILGESTVLVPALVLPLLLGGLTRQLRGVFEVLGAETAILAATILPNSAIELNATLGALLFTWLMVGVGFGLIATVVQRVRGTLEENTSYRDARNLINQLLELSGELVEGLDPVSIGMDIVDLATEEVPITGAVVHVRSSRGITPLLSAESEPAQERLEVASACFDTSAPVQDGPWVALPLSTDAGTVAVLSGQWTSSSSMDGSTVLGALAALSRQLRREALQLDTALLFSAVSDQATSEERRRLARDLHDGVAQDLASLGYLVDDLAQSTDSDVVREHCLGLRAELSKVVAELRRSIFSLRNESDEVSTLGERITTLGQHIEARVGIPVSVALDEGPERLRPDVEAELLRIAQEAMNNAVKHARATRIKVACTVRAPSAQIVVSDDGRGLQAGRDDSHGLRIMRERARRIQASLDLGRADGGRGTVLRVCLGAPLISGSMVEGMATQ